MDRPAFEVLPYSVNALCSIVERVTKSPFHRTKQKRQISYLNNFLLNWGANNPTQSERTISLVVEGNYIDNHYLDDYAQYFVKCFTKYPRDCCRIHFFIDKKIEHDEFRRLLIKTPSMAKLKVLQENYLGYLVVRPLPDTFIAKACLKPYPQFFQNNRNLKILLKEYKASLFGIPLHVSSIAFQEQDKVLSACATSALWSFYQAHGHIGINNHPSAIAITKSAYPENPGADSPFPNVGLNLGMICHSIRENKLEARQIRIPNNEKRNNLLQEQVYAYLSADQPLILGVQVRRVDQSESEDDPNKFHAVTVLGFGLEDVDASSLALQKDDIRTRAERISRLFVHDDRTGPYARLLKKDGDWLLEIDRGGVSEGQKFTPEIYTPTNLVIGVYHKIRLHYPRIRLTCVSLMSRLQEAIKKKFENNQELKDKSDLLTWIVQSLEWDIKLAEVSKLKERLLLDGNIISDRTSVLSRSLPRFIWSAKTFIGDTPFFELLFDATDIPQGDAFLDVIHYDETAQELFELFGAYCKKNFYAFKNIPELGEKASDHIWGIVSHFLRNDPYSEELNRLFGEAKDPQYINAHETNSDAITNQDARRVSSARTAFPLDPSLFYIWVLNQDGVLVIGTEDQTKDAVKNGHPTLICGAPGRIAGELRYEDGRWIVNSRSGRYCYSYTTKERNLFLDNAIVDRFQLYFGAGYEFKKIPYSPPGEST